MLAAAEMLTCLLCVMLRERWRECLRLWPGMSAGALTALVRGMVMSSSAEKPVAVTMEPRRRGLDRQEPIVVEEIDEA